MAGRELVVRKWDSFNVREEGARAKLREIHSEGHVCVELRETRKRKTGEKRLIFFCILCLTPCYSETVLYDHLRGKLHKQRYTAAKVTLFGPVPWPFNDGRFFFTNPKQECCSLVSISKNDNVKKLLDADAVDLGTNVGKHGGISKSVKTGIGNSADKDGKLVLVKNGHGDVLDTSSHPRVSVQNDNAGGLRNVGSRKSCEMSLKPQAQGCGNVRSEDDHDRSLEFTNDEKCLMIPGVFLRYGKSILRVRLMGFGQIASRVCKTDDGGNSKFHRLWCAWLGEGGSDNENMLPETSKCDYAVVVFSYSIDLGTKGGMKEMLAFLSSGACDEIDGDSSPRKRVKRSSSVPVGTSEDLSEKGGSSGEDSPRLKDCCAFTVQSDTTQKSSRASKKAKRRLKRLTAERKCDLCMQPMLPGKDVATLLNLKTGNLACISRNKFGAFHIFHTSCLIHWILLCEFETLSDKSSSKKNTRGRKRKTIAETTAKTSITHVICPLCYGTGSMGEGNRLEKLLLIPASEMYPYRVKASEAHKAWMKNPEILKNCSTGLLLPYDSSDTVEEKVLLAKLLPFYRAEV